MLTIYYTTIGEHAPFLPAHSAAAAWKGWDALDPASGSPAPAAVEGLDAPEPQHSPRKKGTPWTRRIIPAPARSGGRGRTGSAGISSPAPAPRRRVEGMGRPGRAGSPRQRPPLQRKGTPWTRRDHHQRPPPWRKGTPWTRPDHPSTRSRGGRKNRRVYARLFYFLSQKSMYNILLFNAFKISTSNDNIFLSFLQSPPNWGNVSNLVKQYFVIHGNLSL